MFAGKPIIGLVGGIGSGKSHVAGLFGELGCLVIDSDRQVAEAYRRQDVLQALRSWWGEGVFTSSGTVDRAAVARVVFNDPEQRRRLEQLLHPLVGRLREEKMSAEADNPAVVAYIWDTPLLAEAGLAGQCDAVVFVDAPEEIRQRRVRQTRGWSEQEWARRENLQMALDKKRKIANYIVSNTAEVDDEVREQVREVLSRILADVGR